MPDVGTCTSPRLLKRHAELLDTQPSSTTRPPTWMLSLPLELVAQILDATVIHPEDEEWAQEQLTDPRSHGWRSTVAAGTMARRVQRNPPWREDADWVCRRTSTYHRQLLDLLVVCRTFYRHVLPKLYSSPLLLTPSAIQAFTALASQLPQIPIGSSSSNFGSLATSISIEPLTATPSPAILKAWRQHLPSLLIHCPRLSSLALGVSTHALSSSALHSIISSLPLDNNLSTLSMLDLFCNKDSDTPARQEAVLSLISRAPHLRSLSLAGMNFLEEDHTHAKDSGMDDVPALRAGESMLERFLAVMKLGLLGGGVGVEKLFMWQNSAIGVGGLAELLDALPVLRWCVLLPLEDEWAR